MKNSGQKLYPLRRSLGHQLLKLLFILLWLPFFSCNDKDSTSLYDPSLPIQVNAIIPDSGTVALPLVIHGSNFGTDKKHIKVLFDDKEAVIITAQNDHLYVLNPKQSGGNHTVKVKVDEQEGTLNSKAFKYIVSSSVTTIAGTGERDYKDGLALEAMFGGPRYLDVDDQGNILVADYDRWVRLISQADSKVTTLIDASGSVFQTCFSPDYSHLYVAAQSKPQLLHDFYKTANWAHGYFFDDGTIGDYISATAIDDQDNIFMLGYSGSFTKVNVNTHGITYLADLPDFMNLAGEDFCFMTYNPRDKYLYITGPASHAIYRVDSRKDTYEEGDFEVYAGSSSASGLNNGRVDQATFNSPRGIAFDSEGNMFVADYNNNVIRKITPQGMVSTYCGGEAGHKDGVIGEALFNGPSDLAISPDDLIYVGDFRNYRIRCIAVQ